MTTPSIAPPALCPDWVGHRDLYAIRDTSWRLTAEQKRADWADGCGWCGGEFTAAAVAEQFMTPDMQPEVAS
jgi:hypothetical protein